MEALKFEKYLEKQGLAKSSIRTNMMNIVKFFNFCKDNSISQEDISENVIKSYIDFIKKNYSNNTQLSSIQALRKFLCFSHQATACLQKYKNQRIVRTKIWRFYLRTRHLCYKDQE